jgi:hypothetical protein
MADLTATENVEATAETSAPSPGMTRRFLQAYAYGCSWGFLFFLPYVRFLTTRGNRLEIGYSFSTYVEILVLSGVLGLGAVIWFGLVRMLNPKLPEKLREVVERVLLAPFCVVPVVGIGYMTCGQFLWHNFQISRVIWGLLLLAIVCVPLLWKWFWRAGRVLLLLTLFLPLVLLPNFWSYGDVGAPSARPDFSDRDARNRLDNSCKMGGPVYIFLFDGLDRHMAFGQQGRDFSRFPHLQGLAAVSNYFLNPVSPGNSTLESVPRFMYQTALQPVLNGDGSRGFRQGERTISITEFDSIFQHLGGERTAALAAGWSLDYARMLDGKVDWASRAPVSRREGLSIPLTVCKHLWGVWQASYLPGGRIWGIGALYAFENRMLHARAMQSITAGYHDMTTYVHYPVPHPPAVFDRNGVRPLFQMLSESEEYLRSAEYADTLIGELMAALKASGEWDRATLVVMSDHGLGPDKSTRHKDIVLFVKLPGQTEGVMVEEELNTAKLAEWLLTHK